MDHFSLDWFDQFDWDEFLYKQQINPRMFVRCWLGIENLSQEQIMVIEKRRGYRARCVQLIAKVLALDPHSVELYGAGLDFEKMPERNKQKLAIALLARKSTKQAAHNVKPSWNTV